MICVLFLYNDLKGFKLIISLTCKNKDFKIRIMLFLAFDYFEMVGKYIAVIGQRLCDQSRIFFIIENKYIQMVLLCVTLMATFNLNLQKKKYIPFKKKKKNPKPAYLSVMKSYFTFLFLLIMQLNQNIHCKKHDPI